MKFYEYQAKAVFEQHGIPKPEGHAVFKTTETANALKKLGPGPWAAKTQVLAGGRGKAGGVKIVNNEKEAIDFCEKFIGKNLVTHQTGPDGEKIAAILFEKACPSIKKEMYFSVLLDRRDGVPTLLLSAEGGMEIETLAKEKPNAILKIPLNPTQRLPGYLARQIAKKLGLTGKAIIQAASLFSKTVDIFYDTDAQMVEINPLVLTEDNQIMALDGKISTDDNALYRHIDQLEWSKSSPKTPAEEKAAEAKISYIQLDGNVGCLVNGAGLAMATMDIIKLHGGEPANFLDVGGGANTEQVTQAFKIILSDNRVKGILVNIFGGIMRCDVIANGVVEAVKQTKLNVPLVVRLQGTKAEEGKQILADSNLPLMAADSLSEAAEKIVEAVN